MNDLIKRFKDDLQLAGYAKRSIQSYSSAVIKLQRFYNKPLHDITEEQLRQYWLCCQTEFGWSAATLRISYSGIQHFFTKTLVRSWNIFNDIQWKREQTLPTILSLAEVRKIIYALPTEQSHTFYLALYSMGLRLREATTLQVKDILSDRGIVHIHCGKGAQDRMVPLPKITLLALRKYYKTHRNPKWIFPALGRNGGKNAQYAKDHVSDSGVQGVLRSTLKRLKFKKHVHPHVFRHAYATHLLEANIPIRHVQKILGHKTLKSTMVYLHVTTQAQVDSNDKVSKVMQGGAVVSAVQKIFQMYGPQYLALYGERMPQSHKKTIRDIMACRKGAFGTMVYECRDCRNLHFIQCCCGNRHCPNCQHDKAGQWLNQQMKKLLPTHYFLLTITLPKGLREIVRSHQKPSYAALFSCANASLKKLALDKRFIGSDRIGYLAALHTWGGMLQYHPHLHLIIPGGALSDDDQWLSSRQDLFVHTKPLAAIFKAKFKDAMKENGLFDKIDPAVWQQHWVIDSQAVGQGQNSLRYLSRYVFRVAVSNNRIKSIEGGIIRFLYKNREKKKWKLMELDAMEFIRRFLQHVLPKGFIKIRHYGFLNPNYALAIEKIRELISFVHDIIARFFEIPEPEIPGIKCSHCGHDLKFILFVKPEPRCRPG